MREIDNTEENVEIVTETITFNPIGFIVNIIFSAAMVYNMPPSDNLNLINKVCYCIMLFSCFWFVGKLFGFCLRATGNFIIAFFALIALMAGICMGLEKIFGSASDMVLMIIFVILPILDIRKAIKFYSIR